ncbi:hypothetical protein HZF02_17860 [Pseudomonas yamanorum]|nr:hypothetical protein HZF02_17860 [Pseudomonas yamanorum]
MNRYDEILTSTGEQAAAEPNKYDAVIQRQRDLPNPRNTLSYVADTNPDEQANIQRLAELTGLAPEMVSRNRPEIERKAKLDAVDYDALLSRAPVTNKFLTDPNNAGVAHDDIDGLSNVEGAFDNFVKESGQQHSTGTLDALSRGVGQLGLIGEAGANLLDRSLSSVGGFFVNMLAPQSALDRNGTDEPNYTGQTDNNVVSAVEGYMAMPRDQRIAFAGQVFDQARSGGAGFGSAAADTGMYALRNPGLIGSALTEALPSLVAGGGLGGLAAQPAKNFAVSRLASTFAQRAAEKAIVVGGVNFGAGVAGGAGENLAEGFKKTGDIDQSYAYSLKRTLAEASVNALGGMLPIPFAGRGIGGKLGNVAAEGAAQAAGGAGGAAAGAAAVGEEASGGEMFLNAALGLATAPVDVAIAGASSGRRYWQIEQDLAAVQRLGDMAKSSKMFQRSPQRAEALIARLKEQAGGSVENILVPAEQFQRYFQENNLDPEQFATAATGNAGALGEALTLGGDISIPLEKWASVIAKDGHHRGLEQDMRATPDAMTLFGADRKFNIKLTDKANLSTFLHETGHFYLEVMGDLAARADVPDQVKQDYQTVLDWFGVKDRSGVKVDQHEQFARGFEAYLREGKAPSAALQSAFSRFKAWLTQIYRDASRLNVQLNDDVRRVFDRLLATDDEIAVAQAPYRSLFTDAQTAGMSPAEFDAYRATADKAGQAAEERLTAEALHELTREQQKWWKEARGVMQEAVTKEVDAQPVYRVQDLLRKGLQTDGTVGEPAKLSRSPLVERYGKPVVSRLRGMTSDDGIHPDIVAEQFGYTSGDEMVQALVGARGRKELIQAETDARMRAEYGDMLNDGSLADRAIDAVHNDDRAQVVREELRAIDRLRRQVEKIQRAKDGNSRSLRDDAYSAIPSLKDIRAVSQQVIADKVVRDIQPHLYLNAERKANRDAFNFATKNRWQEAAEAKQRELLNHYLYREATAARKEEEKIYTFMRRFEKPSTRERIGKAGASYLEQIEGLLDQYEFRKVSGPQVERRRSLAQFVSEQEAAGNVVTVPQHLIEQSARVNYRDLTFEELNGVRDAVVNIEHLAKLKNKLLNSKYKRDYEQARSDLIRSLNDNVPVDARKVATSESSETTADKAFGALAGLDASLTRMENVINRLDGKNTSGPWHDLVWNPLAEAQANERTLFKNGIRSIVERFAGMDSKRLADRFYIASAGKSFNRREILMHALNTGNESNRTKLLKGNKLNDAALADMLGRLDKQDWDLVQSVWDSFDTLWPDIAAMYKRLSGVEPPRIEPKPVSTAFGEYRGGYFPIMYDRKRAGAPPAAVGGELFNEGFEGALPSNGFTNQRNDNASGPLLLDLSAIPQRLAQHVHDLTHREALQDAHRLTKDPQIRAVLIDKLGPRGADSFLPWLKAIANDRNPPETGNFNRFLDAARTNTSIVGLGLSSTTLLAQVGGLIPGLLYVKPQLLAKSLLDGIRSPVETYRMITDASPAMRLRWDTEDGRLASSMADLIGKNAFFRKRDDLVRFSFNLLGYLDRGISGAIWMASYREGLAAGKDAGAAALDGDKAVRLSQGGTGAMDIAAIQRKDQGAAMRLLTMFYTPFSAYYNQNRDLAFESKQGSRTVASAAAAMLAVAFFQGVVGDLLTGKGPDEDENTAAWMAKSTLGFGVSGFPVIRDTLGAALSGHAGSLSPAWQAINAGRQAAGAVTGLVTGDKEAGAAAKSVVTAGGYLLGVPTKPLTRQGSYLYNVAVGEETPEDAAEFIKALLHGAPKK